MGEIDIEKLRRDRDQLFAEAVQRFDAGEQHWPDANFERRSITPEQQKRFEEDAWKERVVMFVDGQDSVTVLQIAEKALNLATPRVGTAEQRRIAMILTQLGWTRGKRTSTARPWLPPKGKRNAKRRDA